MLQQRSDKGFTLIEGLMSVGILAVLITVLLPDLATIREQREGSLALRRIANLVFIARVEAAKSGVMATLCPTQDGESCGGEWHDGILLFLDHNDDRYPDPEDQIVYHEQLDNIGGTIQWRAFRSKPYLQITPLGFTRYQNGNFTWCNRANSPAGAHQLILNRTGRVRFAQDLDGDGIRATSRGGQLRGAA